MRRHWGLSLLTPTLQRGPLDEGDLGGPRKSVVISRPRSYVRSFLLLGLTVALIAPIPAVGQVVLEGFVTDRSTGLAIAGATVSLLYDPTGAGPVVTDGTGYYSFTGEQVGFTSGSLIFQAHGYFAVGRAFTISPPLPVRLDVSLLPGGIVLQGTVRNAATAAPIAGATVLFGSISLAPGPSPPFTTTDAGGVYSFDSSLLIEGSGEGEGGAFTGAVSASATHFLSSAYIPVSLSPPFPETVDIGLTPIIPNEPPLADAGLDQVVDCTNASGAAATLDGSASSDPDGDSLTFRWFGPFPEGGGTVTDTIPTVTLPLGTSTITLVVNDGELDSEPDTVSVIVRVGVVGLQPPLAALVPEVEPAPFPDTAFRQGSTLPLRVELFCVAGRLTAAEVLPPRIVGLVRSGEPIDLATVDPDAGEANDSGFVFRYAGGTWVYNLSTRGLGPGTYAITIQMPDGLGYTASFVLR